MASLNLQLLALLSAKKANLWSDGLPPKLLGLNKFVAVNSVVDVPSAAGRILLNNLRPDASFIAGGYSTYKCGLTSTYGDVDVFTVVRPGESKKVAEEIICQLDNKWDIDCDWPGQPMRIYPYEHRQKYVVKYSPLKVGHPMYNECDTAACDIVVVESDDRVKNVLDIARDIISDFDLAVCKCVGIPVCNILNGVQRSDIIYMPLDGVSVKESIKPHSHKDCPWANKQHNESDEFESTEDEIVSALQQDEREIDLFLRYRFSTGWH